MPNSSDRPEIAAPSTTAEADLLQRIMAGTAAETGEAFFRALVRNLALALDTHGAWVTDYLPAERKLRARAFWLGDGWVEHYEYDLAGTPCEPVVDQCRLLHIPDRVVDLYPADPDLEPLGAVSYIGMPFTDDDGRVLGHLAVLDTKRLEPTPSHLAIFRIFAARAGAELRRLRADAALRQRELRLARLIEGAMDGIIDFDPTLAIRLINGAAAKSLLVTPKEVLGRSLAEVLAATSLDRLRACLAEFEAAPGERRQAWIAGGLEAKRADGTALAIEATLSAGQGGFHTLIFRDVAARLAAERRIRRLEDEADYLRDELRAKGGGGEVIGRSKALRQALEAAALVAPTEATVLLQGESGTGKELFARAIHEQSRRRGRPLIKVNCAAIPATLVESEFFGHEKGAFTGATARRQGRFALADGGSIFLDEIGDLPLELQAKLLRVLQEGELEPVGSSTTQTVDVRVITATHRDLEQAVAAGSFREDLFYRLAVFPIRIPPLRERGDDIALLAEAFARSHGERFGLKVAPLAQADLDCLAGYAWPGNVRELQNVIERAVITANAGHLDLPRFLPPAAASPPTAATSASARPVRTEAEMRALERDNLRLALEACGWRIAGRDGAARLLGIKPSTLTSRMRAFDLIRPPAGRAR